MSFNFQIHHIFPQSLLDFYGPRIAALFPGDNDSVAKFVG